MLTKQLSILQTTGAKLVSADIEWRCFKDTEYLGPRRKGDVFWGKCADFYEFSGDKISRVQLYLNLRR